MRAFSSRCYLLSPMLHKLSEQVLLLYGDLDRKVHDFASATGLSCPPGCGSCCQTEKVETTVLEMLPLAFHLFQTNQAELIIKRLEKPQESKQCIFFRPDLCQQGKWGCSQYPHRALVCRLFGYACQKDRNGIPRLGMCKVMACKLTEDEVNSITVPIVLFSDAGMQITCLHPGFGTQRLPINVAILQALHKAGIALQMADAELPAQEPDKPENPTPPITPLFPPPLLTKKAV